MQTIPSAVLPDSNPGREFAVLIAGSPRSGSSRSGRQEGTEIPRSGRGQTVRQLPSGSRARGLNRGGGSQPGSARAGKRQPASANQQVPDNRGATAGPGVKPAGPVQPAALGGDERPRPASHLSLWHRPLSLLLRLFPPLTSGYGLVPSFRPLPAARSRVHRLPSQGPGGERNAAVACRTVSSRDSATRFCLRGDGGGDGR